MPHRSLGSGPAALPLFSLLSWGAQKAQQPRVTLLPFGAAVPTQPRQPRRSRGAGGTHSARGAQRALRAHGSRQPPEAVGAHFAGAAGGSHGARFPRGSHGAHFPLGSLLSLPSFGAGGTRGSPLPKGTRRAVFSRWTRRARLSGFSILSALPLGAILAPGPHFSGGSGIPRKPNRTRVPFGAVVTRGSFSPRWSRNASGAGLAFLSSVPTWALAPRFALNARRSRLAGVTLLSWGSHIADPSWGSLRSISSRRSGGTAGSGGAGGAHGAAVPRLTLLTCGAGLTLQADGAGGAVEAARPFVPFGTKVTLRASGTRSPICASSSGLSK